jgi:SAM-dependent methyltransferase
MHVEYVAFNTRISRTEYLVERFGKFLQGKVLDVGCNEAPLRKLMPGLDYTGIDVGGTPDLQVDLESVQNLPFEDGEFDAVVCIDVLEHLDNLHAMFDELVRVAKTHLVISLPNCWSGARKPIERGHGAIGHYGLPITRPVDRHKWFFSLSEAQAFFEDQTQRLPISLVEIEATERPRFPLKRLLRRLRHPEQVRYLNRYAHTLWAVFKKGQAL